VPYVGVGLGVLWMLARPLDALAFGDETAQSLGLPLAWTRLAIVAATSLTTARQSPLEELLALWGSWHRMRRDY
jgi:ABC-type Fe3+-siderophore transport system permease subunit